MITSIRIRRFRSINDMTIEFGKLTALVGRNDVGKSNVARALNLFFHGETDIGRSFNFDRDYNRNSIVPEKKAKEIVIEVTFELPPTFKNVSGRIVWKKVWRAQGSHQISDPLKFENRKPVPASGKIRTAIQRHFLQFAPAIKDVQFFAKILGDIYEQLSSDSSGQLKQSGENFDGALRESADGLICGLKEALKEEFSVSLPDDLRPIFEKLDIRNAEGIPFDRRGDGVKIRHIPELFQFISNLIDEDLGQTGAVKANHFWIFEEPENNLEFRSAFEMVERLRQMLGSDTNIQVLMTTHSPVFYGMQAPGDAEESKRHFIFQNDKGFSERKTINEHELDDEMGLLPVVATALEPIKEQLAAVEASRAELEKAGHDLEKSKIYVEGKSDELIVQRALEVQYPRHLDKVEVICPDNGGANAAKNWLHAWQLIQQHRPNPVRAVALLDKDKAGEEARDALNALLGSDPKHVRAILLQADGAALSGLPPGYTPIVEIESLLPNQIWNGAKANGHLEPRNGDYLCDHCFPENVKKALKSGQLDADGRFQGLSEPQRMRLEFKFSNEGKIAVSNQIRDMNDEEATQTLEKIKPSLNKAFKFLFPDIS